MHWAQAFVKDMQGKQLVSTGISPSGPIHVGNMREILTGHFIYSEMVSKGLEADFIYLCDDIDPLRKMYPFLPGSFEKFVGYPLYRIQSPDGVGTYSEHFLKPFLETLDLIAVKVRVIRSHDLYGNGDFADIIDLSIRRRKEIAEILSGTSGREIEGDWYPYSPVCPKCGRITSTTVVGYEKPFVSYVCKCGNSGRADIRKDDGKMPWRVEWPAKWSVLGVTMEPFGKDHGAAGGSYDTGKLIAEKIFGISAPKPLMYEWISLKGKGTMHSSTGINIAASDCVKMAPPEILRYLIARNQPSRHIEFDPGNGLLTLVDEFERLREEHENGKLDEDRDESYRLSSLGASKEVLSVGFRHLVTLIQIYPDESGLLNAMKRSGYPMDTISENMHNRIAMIKRWLNDFAPEEIKFRLLPVDSEVNINDAEKKLLRSFLESIDSIQWQANDIHNRIHELLKESGIPPGEGFGIFYKTFIGKSKGPRLGYFFSNLNMEFVKNRLEFASR